MPQKHRILSRSECVRILKGSLPYLRQTYGVTSLAIFGSMARNQIRGNSDVDVLISFVTPPSLFTLIQIENYLTKHLRMRVDLVAENSIKPSFRKRILRDLIQI
jgi:predicted nucleotidyltransferase